MIKIKIWLITAALLVLAGALIFAGVMTVNKWDFSKLSTLKYETADYEFEEKFENIDIRTKTADIVFCLSENGKTKVVCYEQTDIKHQVEISGGSLLIKVVDTRKWYQYMGVDFGSPKITVYLPATQYNFLTARTSTGDIEIPKEFFFESMDITQSTGDITNYASVSGNINLINSTGDIRLENISANSVSLSLSTGRITVTGVECKEDMIVKVSTGKTYLTDVKCKNLVSQGDTGDISLTSVTAFEKFSLERDTGDIIFEKCDAADIYIKTSTGDVKGTLLTEKVFITQTGTGNTDVPKTVTGGKCEITTSTGDIKIQIHK